MKLLLRAADLRAIFQFLCKIGNADTVATVDITDGSAWTSDGHVALVYKSPILLPDSIQTEEKFAVNAKRMLQAAGNLLGDVTLETVGKKLRLKAGKVKYDLATEEPTPRPPEVPVSGQGETISFNAELLKTCLDYIAPVADTQNFADFYGTVSLHDFCFATDGARVCRYGKDGQVNLFPPEKPLLLPARVSGLIQWGDSFLNVIDSDSVFHVGSDTHRIVVAKINTEFPDVAAYIPSEWKAELTVDATLMRECLKRIQPTLGEERKIDLTFDGDTVVLTAESSAGISHDEMGTDIVYPDPLMEEFPLTTFALDHRLVADLFSRLQGSVTVKFNAPDKPIWFESGEKGMLLAPLVA